MQNVLLHICCAPCSAAIIEWFIAANIRIALFFYNPNIYPQTEYNVRKTEIVRYAHAQKVEIIDGDYDHDNWSQHVSGFEHEPERGVRCLQCFKMRMLATARLAHERHFGMFATSLASSRWKSLEQIARAGHWAAAQYDGVEFFEKNWRQGGLSERRIELLNENKFYNQKYCGCEFSMRVGNFFHSFLQR